METEIKQINEFIRKWNLWCCNYRTPFENVICEIWGGALQGFGGRCYCPDNFMAQHIIEKWQSMERLGDSRMMMFYLELDTECREKLVEWMLQNYRG